MKEGIFFRVRSQSPEDTRREFDQRIKELTDLPLAEIDRRIAEDRFRKPIEIFNRWAIRPFWRDWRKASPLKKASEEDLSAYNRLHGHP